MAEGMDAENERLVFRQIVQSTTSASPTQWEGGGGVSWAEDVFDHAEAAGFALNRFERNYRPCRL